MSLTDPNVLSLICVICGSILGWVIKHHLGGSDLFGKKPAASPAVTPPATSPVMSPSAPQSTVSALPSDISPEAVLAVQRFLDRKKAEAHEELKKLIPG